MKDSLERVYQNRLNTVAEAVKTNYSGKNILYTGDFRGHGRKSYSALLSRLPQVDILICERTNPDGDAIQKLIKAVNPKETIFVHGEV